MHGFISLLKHRHLNFLTCSHSQTKSHQTMNVLEGKIREKEMCKALDDDGEFTIFIIVWFHECLTKPWFLWEIAF